MRTIIAGSRTITDSDDLDYALTLHMYPVTTVLCGMAKGADMLGLRYAQANNIPVERYPADWDKHGRSAGYIRNEEMAKNADACIVIWDGVSKGSQHMISLAKKYKLVLTIVKGNVNGNNQD